MSNSVNKLTDFVIEKNRECKIALFSELSHGLAADVWFYVHLGNYGNTVCTFKNEPNAKGLTFSLRFERCALDEDKRLSTQHLFTIEYSYPTGDSWEDLIEEMRNKAKVILGVAE